MRFSPLALPLALALASPAWAAPSAAPSEAAERPHRVEKLGEGAWAILGQGGNLALLATERAAVLVDAQFERQVPALLDTVRSLTDRPLRWLVLSHHHADHAGGAVALEKQGVVVAAHVNARRRLAAQQARQDPARRGGLPTLTYGSEDGSPARMALHLDGLEVRLLHFAAGHTDGDTVVWVPSARVVHLGDLFFHGRTPEIDVASGGNLAGLIAVVEKVLAMVPDDVRVIPGHGPVCGKRDLARFREFLLACQAHVRAHPGQPGSGLARTFDRAAFPDYSDLAPFLTWETFFETAAGRVPGKK